jgi:hypothetical protein
MATTPQVITTTPEARQIAKVLHFPPDLAPYIDWESVARQAREMGANFEARFSDNGSADITLFWQAYGVDIEDVATVEPTSHAPTATDRTDIAFAIRDALDAHQIRNVPPTQCRIGGTGWTLEDLVQATDAIVTEHDGTVTANDSQIRAWATLILTNEPARWVEEDV